MIPIKIQCGCGQRYAFEVEPVNGRMPSAVACPVCGADGTEAANAGIAQSVPPPTAAVVAPPVNGAPLRVSTPAPAVRLAVAHAPAPAPAVRLAAAAAPQPAHGPPPSPSRVSVNNRTQSEHEARAKVSWGDPPEAVINFLMIQGFTYPEASQFVQALFKDRAAAIRRNGFKKLCVGIALMCVPIIALLAFLSMGYIPLKLFAVTIMIGLWGAWKVLKSLFMILAPKSEPGDVAEQ